MGGEKVFGFRLIFDGETRDALVSSARFVEPVVRRSFPFARDRKSVLSACPSLLHLFDNVPRLTACTVVSTVIWISIECKTRDRET